MRVGSVRVDIPRDRPAIVLSVLAALGWLVFVCGFGKHEHDESGLKLHLDSNIFVFWGLALAGLPGILFMQLYGCNPGRMLGVLALFLNLFMLVCAGGVVEVTGSRIHQCLAGSRDNIRSCMFIHGDTNSSGLALGWGDEPFVPDFEYISVKPYERAEFAGAFLYVLFQSMSLCLYFWRAHSISYDDYETV